MSENYFTWTPKKKKQDTDSDVFDQNNAHLPELFGSPMPIYKNYPALQCPFTRIIRLTHAHVPELSGPPMPIFPELSGLANISIGESDNYGKWSLAFRIILVNGHW